LRFRHRAKDRSEITAGPSEKVNFSNDRESSFSETTVSRRVQRPLSSEIQEVQKIVRIEWALKGFLCISRAIQQKFEHFSREANVPVAFQVLPKLNLSFFQVIETLTGF
jgi:hypothetical protein